MLGVYPPLTDARIPPEADRHGVDIARQAAAGYGCEAALDVEKWLEEQK